MRPFPLKMAVSYSYKQNKPLFRRKFSMRKNLTEVVFILDRSGSMSGLEMDTIPLAGRRCDHRSSIRGVG